MIPVPQVADVDCAFPTLHPLEATLAQIPVEVFTRGRPGYRVTHLTAAEMDASTVRVVPTEKWDRLFAVIFYFSTRMNWERFGLLPKKDVNAADAWRALTVLIRVWDIKHERKEAAWAYLASQWFDDVRWEQLDGETVTFNDVEFDAAWLEHTKEKA